MLGKLAIVLLIINVCHGFFFGHQPDWNGLKVRWGFNPFTSFLDMPRTRAAARSDGWVAMNPADTCNGNANFRGERMWKDSDLGVILIFDPAGYIAGIQAGIPKDYPENPNNYPALELVNASFVLQGNNYYITTYFVNPADLCQGRTASDFREDGTGVGLWIQNGTNPEDDSIKIPSTQREIDASMWTKGKCFPTMGVHYWYNIEKDMPCSRFFPLFVMYNDGKLNSFGWAFGMNLENSDYLEHPPSTSYHTFLDPVPDCLLDWGTLTTLHIYLTDSAAANWC